MGLESNQETLKMNTLVIMTLSINIMDKVEKQFLIYDSAKIYTWNCKQ